METKKYYCYMCREFTETKFFKNNGFNTTECVECGTLSQPTMYGCPECGAETAEESSYSYCTLNCEIEGNIGRCMHYQEYIKYLRLTEEPWLFDKEEECPCNSCEFHEVEIENGTLINIENEHYCYSAAMNFGGSPYDWTENHKCWNCGTEYEIENSNY